MIQREYNARRVNEDNKENRNYKKVTVIEPIERDVQLPSNLRSNTGGIFIVSIFNHFCRYEQL
jgi:hypothetical protein